VLLEQPVESEFFEVFLGDFYKVGGDGNLPMIFLDLGTRPFRSFGSEWSHRRYCFGRGFSLKYAACHLDGN
jgi:hypothetical protein